MLDSGRKKKQHATFNALNQGEKTTDNDENLNCLAYIVAPLLQPLLLLLCLFRQNDGYYYNILKGRNFIV